ncbi:MAG TPA: hypothetical protein VFN05_11880 [Actinomycetes bacterium]|nr:hypothetical protein [Actinomycetes bacterium]
MRPKTTDEHQLADRLVSIVAVLVLDAVLVPDTLCWLTDFGLAIVLTRRPVRARVRGSLRAPVG